MLGNETRLGQPFFPCPLSCPPPVRRWHLGYSIFYNALGRLSMILASSASSNWHSLGLLIAVERQVILLGLQELQAKFVDAVVLGLAHNFSITLVCENEARQEAPTHLPTRLSVD